MPRDESMGPAPKGRTIAFVERQKMLFAQGYGELQILNILQHEFRDYETRQITIKTLGNIYKKFRSEFDEARRKFMEDCEIVAQEQLKHCFNMVRKTETEMCEVLNDKIKKINGQIAELDLEDDYDMDRYRGLLVLLNATHDKLSKIAGTDAMREYNLFKAKLEVKKEIDMNPVGDARIVKEGRTKFIT